MGIDFVEAAIERAKKNAADEGLSIDFRVGSALELGKLSDRFDNAIDSGLFHVLPLDGEDRYASGMHSVLRPGGRLFLLGFSDAEPGTHGPKRLTRAHLERVFAKGWTIESIEPAVLETVGHHKDAQGLFAVIRRD